MSPSASVRIRPLRARVLAAGVACSLGAGLLTAGPAGAARDAGSSSPMAGAEHPTAQVADPGARVAKAPRLRVRTVQAGLDLPWDVADLGGGRLLVTERDRARISLITREGRRTVRYPARTVWRSGETGLMSIALDADVAENRRIYVCQGGYTADGSTEVQVVAMRLSRSLRATKGRSVLLGGLPSSSGRHGGCRLLLADDGSLVVGTGDAATTGVPRDLDSLGGKTLRLDPRTGEPWPGNPFASAGGARAFVHTYGHRNVQGLAQRSDGTLWSVEHGSYRDDEVNLLVDGGDYGWEPGPGYDESSPMTDQSLPGEQVEAAWSSGEPTIAPSGAAWVRGKRWGSLRGTLAVAVLGAQRMLFLRFDADGTLVSVRAPKALQRFGRLRSVVSARDGDLLVTTSNGMGRDRVLRVSPR